MIISNNRIFNATYGENITLNDVSEIIVANNILYDNADGIGVDNASSCVIIGNVIRNASTEGIDIAYASSGNSIIGNIIEGCSFGIGLRAAGGLTPIHNVLIGNVCKANSMDGIVLVNDKHTLVKGNILLENKRRGLSLEGSSYNIVFGNHAAKNAWAGIVVAVASNNIVSDNYIVENSQAADTTYHNLEFWGASHNNFIQGNIIRIGEAVNRPRWGIFIPAETTDSVIKNNDLRNSGVHGAIQDAGVGTIIEGNPGYVDRNSGVATFSGDGVATSFTFAHGLADTPTVVNLEARSADAAGDKHWSADAVNITVTFITAPPAGTNNVVIGWEAKVR